MAVETHWQNVVIADDAVTDRSMKAPHTTTKPRKMTDTR